MMYMDLVPLHSTSLPFSKPWQRRQALKEQFHLDNEEEEEPAVLSRAEGVEPVVEVFDDVQEGVQSTVRITPLDLNSEDEEEEEEEESEGGEDAHPSAGPQRTSQARAYPAPAGHTDAPEARPHKKLTKAALKTMERTRFKIQGKKIHRGGKSAANKAAGSQRATGGKKGRDSGPRETRGKGRGKGKGRR